MYNFFEIELKNINAFAHSKGDIESKEPFVEHSERCEKYYKKIIDEFNLYPILDNLINKIDSELDKEKIKQYLFNFIRFHDIGKLTHRFQKKLDGQKNNETHSDKSFYLLAYGLLELNQTGELDNKEFILLFITLHTVYKHHGNLSNILDELPNIEFKSDKNRFKEICDFLKIEIDENIVNNLESKEFWLLWKNSNIKNVLNNFSQDSLAFFLFIKLYFSLLTSSDYYATFEYMEDQEFEFEKLHRSKITQIFQSFHEQEYFGDWKNFNVEINKNKEKYENINLSDDNLTLNELRSYLNVIAENKLEKILNDGNSSNVHFLNVPTGGGKTNISMRLALTIMEKKNINKLFYVFPFINIIEQSYDTLGKFIGSDNLTRLDSRYISPIESDDYEAKEMFSNYINTLFFNKPVLFSSHVKFFDLFFRNDKNSNYNFFQLANSIVIIDEIQAYNENIWTEVSALLEDVSRLMNTHFIVMSATLPEIDQLNENSNINWLLDEKECKDIFNHKLFKRTEIIFDPKVKKEKLKREIIKSKIFNKILIVFNKVKNSYNFYSQLLQEKKLNSHNIVLLNSTIVDERRKSILENCSKKENKIILVSTQSVEAGVDIDFDIGFRAYAPIDSVVQVAGRINRNNEKELSRLIVFEDEEYKKIYRHGFKSIITEELKTDIFNKKMFNEYSEIIEFYKKMIVGLKERNENPFIESSSTNLADMKNLFYKIIDKKVHLIEGDTISLFIPYNEAAINLWKEYLDLFNTPNSLKNMIKIKDYRRKLNPYIINIFNSYTKHGQLRQILNEEIKYGFYYCKNWTEYFSFNSGLDVEKFKEIVLSDLTKTFEIL